MILMLGIRKIVILQYGMWQDILQLCIIYRTVQYVYHTDCMVNTGCTVGTLKYTDTYI